MPRQATVLPCQDIRFEYDGKYTLVGVFTSNIGIPAPGTPIPQFSFLVIIEGDVSEPLVSLIIEMHFPDTSPPMRMEVPLGSFPRPVVAEGQTRWRVQIPVTIAPVLLNPGRIFCKIIHDLGEIEAGVRWVTIAPPTHALPLVTTTGRAVLTPSSTGSRQTSGQSPPDAPSTA